MHMNNLGDGSLKKARAQCWWQLTGQMEGQLGRESSRQALARDGGAQRADHTSWNFFASCNQTWNFLLVKNTCI